MWTKLKNLTLDILFPKFCLNCEAEGSLLCQDCESLLEISGFHIPFSTLHLKDLYFPCSFQNPLAKALIQKFVNEPFIKELAKPLSALILAHFQLMDNKPDLTDFVLIPVPTNKKELKQRGYNPSQELVKELSKSFNVPITSEESAKDKKILLVDSIYSQNCPLEEYAKTLKESSVREIQAIVIARI